MAEASAKRAGFLRCLGRLPERCDLSPRVEGVERLDGYTRERVTFESSPGVRVPAYVLVPDGMARSDAKGPFPRPKAGVPVVLCLHQHNGEYPLGKSEPAGLAGSADMAYALELCRRGFVTLVFDQLAFEERQCPPELRTRAQAAGVNAPEGMWYERFVAFEHLQRGSTLQARYTWDAHRAIDYLCTRPEVDASRLGVIGHSLGGQQAAWAMLFDDRLKCGVCSCGIGTFETIFRDGINHNCAAYLPGLLDVGDVDAMVATLAPRPFMLTAGTSDPIFPIDGVRRIAEAARAAYAAAGDGDAFRFVEFAGGHGFRPETRAEAYAWLERWL